MAGDRQPTLWDAPTPAPGPKPAPRILRVSDLNRRVRGLIDADALLADIYVEGEVLGVDLPVTVDLVVTQTEPGFAGDTATGAKKSATVETGLTVQVPLFVEEGDILRVDTRTGEYVTRVQ